MAQQIKFGDKLLLKGETLILDNGASHGELKSKNGTLWIKGDLIIDGTTTTVNTATLTVDDKNIELGSVTTPTDATADGGGITLKGTTDKTILWIDSTDSWDFNQKVKSTNGFEGDLTGDVTGDLTGNVTGTIGATTPHAGIFTTITGALTSFNTDFDTRLATKDTDDLSEGSTNLYYTDARVDARYAILHANADADTLDGFDSLHFLNYNNLTNTPTAGTNISISGTNVISATTYVSSDFTHDDLTGFVANEHIDWTSASAGTIHASNYTNTTYVSSDFTHDDLTGFVANEHIDWTSASAGTIHASNYTNTTYVDSDWNHDSLTGFVANEHIDWTSASAGTIDPSNYVNTGDTTYTAGTGLTLVGTVFSNTAPDQTVSLTGTGATTITGTYPNFTIDSTDTAIDITGTIIPATDDTYDLGSSAKKYANIYGHSVEATFADLAERYATDVPYECGTVVVFGGEAEITTTTEPGDVSVAGVISTNPALKLNADAGNSETHPYVALRGRVPCKLIGPVSKGDLIVTADNEPGYAQSIGKNDAGRSVFAKSIETDLTVGKKVIEVSIL